MKYFIAIFVAPLVILNHQTWASSCRELQQELASVQHRLDSETLNECSEQNKRYCCDQSDPSSCKTIYRAKLEYNDALAKLTILEGLVALGSSVEGKHNALRNLTPEQVTTAKQNVSEFLSSFRKANILQKSFQLNGDDSLWDDYKGENIDQMQAYLNALCVNPQAYKPFCSELAKAQEQTLKKGDRDGWIDIVETLQGFSEADRNVLDTDRDTNFRSYSDYLKVRVDGKLVDIDHLNDNESIKKVKELQRLISSYEQSKAPATLAKIQTLSKALDAIDINYNASAGVKGKFSDFAQKTLIKDATKLHSASGVFLNIEDTHNNLLKVQETLGNELKIRKQSLDKDVTAFTQNMNCNGKDPIQCIEEACKPVNGECQQDETNKELFARGINEVYKKIHTFKETEKTNSALEKINECFSNDPDSRLKLTDLPACIKEHFDTLGFKDSIKQARKNLEQKQKVLDFLQAGMPIRKYEITKAFLVNALESKQCIKRSKISGIKSYCTTPELNQQGQAILQIKGQVEGVLYDYNEKLFQKFLTNSGYSDDYKEYREQFVASCKENPEFSHLCQHLEREIISERPIRPVSGLSSIARINTRRPSGEKVDFEDEGNSSWAYVGAGIGSLAMMGVQAYIQTDMQNRYTEQQVAAWNWQSDWNAKWNQWYANRPSYYYSNWGYGAWNTGGLYNFNYGNDQIYYNTGSLNFSQFNFVTPAVTQGQTTPLVQSQEGIQF